MDSFKKVYLVIALLLPMLIGGFFAIKRNSQFEANVSERIVRGVRSNSPETAREELGKAISWLEEKKMVEGNSAVTWQTPASDIGFWFKNLKDAHAKLGGSPSKEISLEASQAHMSLVESSIVMERIQASLLDKDGSVKIPMFVSFYPNQKSIFWSFLIGTIMGMATIITLVVKYS
jgi:hypothetical protein